MLWIFDPIRCSYSNTSCSYSDKKVVRHPVPDKFWQMKYCLWHARATFRVGYRGGYALLKRTGKR